MSRWGETRRLTKNHYDVQVFGWRQQEEVSYLLVMFNLSPTWLQPQPQPVTCLLLSRTSQRSLESLPVSLQHMSYDTSCLCRSVTLIITQWTPVHTYCTSLSIIQSEQHRNGISDLYIGWMYPKVTLQPSETVLDSHSGVQRFCLLN